jgi:hypothetical protein
MLRGASWPLLAYVASALALGLTGNLHLGDEKVGEMLRLAPPPSQPRKKITYELRISKNINLSFIDSANLTVNRATGAQAEGGEVCTVVIQ